MLQFNSMDRPEDRPNTLKWIILGNLLPGLLISVYFQNIFEKVLHEPYLVMIIVLAVSIGDGLSVRRKVAEGYGVRRAKWEADDLAAFARRTGLSLSEARTRLDAEFTGGKS